MAVLRLVCLSDTHGRHDRITVPSGDLLIHAGDLSSGGGLEEIRAFAAWFEALPHAHKIVIAGNHDFACEREPEAARALLSGCHYLQDDEVEVAGLRIYGSPWQPWFYDWAFNLRRGAEIRAKWERIPSGIDILVTHGPPEGHGDRTVRGARVGCADLAEIVARRRPRFHVFGHIHEGYGVTREGGTTFVNASSCTVGYEPTNPPLVFEVDVDGRVDPDATD